MNQVLQRALGVSEFQLAVLIVSVIFAVLIVTGIYFWRRWDDAKPRGPAGVEPDQPWPRPPARRPICQDCGGPVSDLIEDQPYFCAECRGPAYFCFSCAERIGFSHLKCTKHMPGRAEGA